MDSDEETDIKVTTSKRLPEKKSIAAQPTKSLARRENDHKRRLTKNVDENKNLSKYALDLFIHRLQLHDAFI